MCYRHHEIPTILACLHVNLIITHFLSVCTFLCVMAIDAECIFAIFLYCLSIVETFECKLYSNLNINTANWKIVECLNNTLHGIYFY